jgi:hypothetical protein
MDKWGIGYRQLSEINPKIIYIALNGFGQWGPYVERPSYDAIAQSESGMAWITGFPDKLPLKAGIWLADYFGGLMGAVGVLGALAHRDRTGKGQYIEFSQLKGPGPDPGIGGGPAQRRHMGRRQHGIHVQENQEVSPGHPGPRIHLGPPPPRRMQPTDVGKPGRHLPGGVAAAAVHQDDLQIRVRGQAQQSLGQDGGLIEDRDNKGNVRLRRGGGRSGARHLLPAPIRGMGAAARHRRRPVL